MKIIQNTPAMIGLSAFIYLNESVICAYKSYINRVKAQSLEFSQTRRKRGVGGCDTPLGLSNGRQTPEK